MVKDSDTKYEKSNRKSLIPEGLLPAYLAYAFAELYEEDGIAVIGKGLGWIDLLAAFVRFYADKEEGHTKVVQEINEKMEGDTPVSIRPSLVLVLGLRDSELNSLISILETWGTPKGMLPKVITNESGQGRDRAELYEKGGIFCVTSRILIVDILTNLLNPKSIDGLLIGHAERVTSESTEAFIVRIYSSQINREKCFIKAFTDSPEGLFSEFSKIDKVLKALQVRRLYLFPRFHDLVRRELEMCPPDVEELYQSLSPGMKKIQSAIVAAVQTCMRELKKMTPFVEWTGEELSIENCVTSSFDRAITRQLNRDWHRLKPQTKQLVQDLRTLRQLFSCLIQYDCVSFWKLINNIKTMSAASRNPSMWLLTPSADLLFKQAKARLYKVVEMGDKGNPTAPVGRLKTILEENPKWRLLHSVLSEIKINHRRENDLKEPTILVMVRDERNIERLRQYLVDGRARTMNLSWLKYLESYNDRSRSVTGNKLSQETRLLFQEEGRLRRSLFGGNSERSSRSNDLRKRTAVNVLPTHVKKRRRIAVEKNRGKLGNSTEDLERKAVLDEPLSTAEHDLDHLNQIGCSLLHNEIDDSDDDVFESMFSTDFIRSPKIAIRSFSSLEDESGGALLRDLEPDHVILYDVDIAFVRSLEVYSTMKSNDQFQLKVYFLIFEASAEEKVYSNALERERRSFEQLIQYKRTMPPPLLQSDGTQEMQQAVVSGSIAGTYGNGALPLAFDTRSGKGKHNSASERRDIVVDVREFRSALPSILHQGGMRLAPITLTVGDFVLSAVHCVERKSISDLFGSFASGRLYSQSEAMCKYYQCPCLLIEFDPSKSFCLQNASELGVEITTESACSKMAILTMHFPKLRILWSRSPHETLRLFKDLKAAHGEVDVERALEIGRNDVAEFLIQSNENCDDDEVNATARDMLLRLPGVNVHNARRIMAECDSLVDLAMKSRQELRRIAGPVAGQKLFTFFRQTLASA